MSTKKGKGAFKIMYKMYKYSNLLLQTFSSSQQVHPKLLQVPLLAKQARAPLDLIVAPSTLSTLAVTVLLAANLLPLRDIIIAHITISTLAVTVLLAPDLLTLLRPSTPSSTSSSLSQSSKPITVHTLQTSS